MERENSSIFINLSNHPSSGWSEEQMEAANKYGKVQDLPFPDIKPSYDSKEVEEMAEQYLDKILKLGNPADITVHIMGEMVFTYKLVAKLKENGILCVASTTERITSEKDGVKTSVFKFRKFREY